MKPGLVSVLMGTYNCENTIESAVQSILDQTYTNWQLIICDDGSTDNTVEIIERIAEKDSRIKIIKNEKNQGLNITLNKCLALAEGEFIARMDGDDLCVKGRLEKQVSFLNEQDSFDIVSSWMALFDDNGEWGISKPPEFPQAEAIVTGNPICHAPVMMRSESILSVGGYTENPRALRVEDVDLWIRLYAAGYRAYNIQEVLYMMRNDQNALKRRKYKYRVNSAFVRLSGCKNLHLGLLCYIKACSPLIVGLIPARVRDILSRKIKYAR